MKTLKVNLILIAVTMVSGLAVCTPFDGSFVQQDSIADHTVIDELRLGRIAETDIELAKEKLVIGYGHTSHGSQITTGMSGLIEFANSGGLKTTYSTDLFSFNSDGTNGALHLLEGDGYGTGELDHDAGYYPAWVDETRELLDDSANASYNVIMWSWCGQVSDKTETSMINEYLEPMEKLEADYPGVVFVYMTGHLDGSGGDGNLHKRNEQIREFCLENNKWLFDFADIESRDPDGNHYLDRGADDACNYSGGNWAIEWQNTHTEGTDWYSCSSAHSQPLNANMKAYAAWWLFCRIAGEIDSRKTTDF